MPRHRPWETYAGNFSLNRFAMNGCVPHVSAWRSIANTYNSASAYLRRQVFAHAFDVQGVLPATAGTQIPYQFCFRTGDNVERMAAMLGVIPTTQTRAGGADPAVALVCIPPSPGATSTSGLVRYFNVDATAINGPANPSDVAWMRIYANVEPNTQYLGRIELYDYARIWSATAWEEAPDTADDTVTGVCNPAVFEAGAPIRSGDVKNVIETGTTLWKHNAGQLLAWSSKGFGSVTVSNVAPGATYTNILDGVSTTNSTTTPGFCFSTQRLNSASGDVPLEMGVLAYRQSGTGTLDVRVVGSSVVASVTGITGANDPYESSLQTTPAALSRKYDIQCRVNGTATFSLEAVGLWVYEP